jgi:hypothetical protein
MKYLFLFIIIIASCKSKLKWPVQLKDDEIMVIQTSSYSCFNTNYYKTKIKRENNFYQISFYELKKINPNCFFIECYDEIHKRSEKWDQEQLDTFLKTIKTDTSIQSTSSTMHLIICKGDRLEFKEGGGKAELIRRYYE